MLRSPFQGLKKPPVGSTLDWGDPINQGLIACWPSNERAGGFVRDIARKNDLTLVNGPTWVGGKDAGAISLDGTNDAAYRSGLVPTLAGSTSVSMTIWVKALTGMSAGAPFYYPDGIGNVAAGFYFPNSTTLRFDVVAAGANNTVADVIGSWKFLALTWDGATKKGYLDGVEIYSAAQASSIVTASNEINIGRFSSNPFNPFLGLADNARIYRRGLTPTAVKRLYREPFAGIAGPGRHRFVRTVAGGAPNLVVADATHAHAADSLTLTTDSTLAIADATHAHAADSVVLTTASTLAVADALHGHTTDAVTLTTASALVVADALHDHTADNVVLSLVPQLTIADATHAHAADSLTFTLASTLAVADAVHGHAADSLGLTLLSWLAIADAWHVHMADSVAVNILAPVTPSVHAQIPMGAVGRDRNRRAEQQSSRRSGAFSSSRRRN